MKNMLLCMDLELEKVGLLYSRCWLFTVVMMDGVADAFCLLEFLSSVTESDSGYG